ncbi:protein kinase [Deinococcus lacus]|uniref:Protein kinase n=1 Tax=Deinococcus lacus TaxID=392561 RepID=A0ABW1YEC7_9DEIO
MTEPDPQPHFVPAGYTLSHLLGRGATSLVFLARDPKGREVALKLPHTENENPAAAEMFSNEVRMSLQLRHANLVQGLDGTPFGEGAFLALEYLPGGALDTRLAAGPLPYEQALSLLRDVALALQYLHGMGAVHQDVKAQNVYLRGQTGVLGDLGNSFMAGQGARWGAALFIWPQKSTRAAAATVPATFTA